MGEQKDQGGTNSWCCMGKITTGPLGKGDYQDVGPCLTPEGSMIEED